VTEKAPFKRRAVFIQPAFQGRFILWMLAIIGVFAVVSAAILYFLLANDLENETRTAHLRIADTWQKLGTSIVISNLISALFAGITVAIVVVYISHKIAGPMYRFQALFREVARGNLEVSAHLREHDQLQELAASFDVMLKALRDRKKSQDQALAEMRDLVQQLKDAAAVPDRQQELLAELAKSLDAMQGPQSQGF
jgi:methyl-accepting chemotaxis protein